MSTNFAEYVTDVEAIVDDMLKEWDESIDQAVAGVPLDTKRPDDAAFKVFVEMQIAKDETWLMRVAEAENGKEIIDRYMKVTGQ